MSTPAAHAPHADAALGAHLSPEKMPAHWLMARLGKRVLRPGGVELTRWLLETSAVRAADDVVELAPGLGATAREILARVPRSYAGVDRDAEARRMTAEALAHAGFEGFRLVEGDAASVPLDDGVASVVFGEAMLSMQSEKKKARILDEAHRLLRLGGRYAIHELAVVPDDVDPAIVERIERDLSRTIHVGVRIGTVAHWRELLEAHGFEIQAVKTAPMRLLEADRLVHDEGALGAARFVVNALRTPGAARRLASVRAVFREHEAHLRAVGIVARRA